MTGQNESFRVVVGVDGSSDARYAAEVGLSEAAAHGGQLLVVHAWHQVMPITEPASLVVVGTEHLREAAQRVLDSETEYLRRLGTGVSIRSRLEYGSAADVLAEIGWNSDLLVVGSRGRGRVRGLLLGSVSQTVTAGAGCPVLVVPERKTWTTAARTKEVPPATERGRSLAGAH